MSWEDAVSAASAVGGLCTAGALGVSLLLLSHSIEDRRRAQAGLVAAWVDRVDMDAKPWPEVALRVRNSSELPVTDVGLQLGVGVRGTFTRYLPVLAPKEIRELIVYLPAYPRSDALMPALQFRDTAGRQWMRTETGQLRRVKDYLAFEEDSGSYDEHPTLRLPEDWQERLGRRVPEGE